MIYSIVPQQGPLFLSREAEFGKIETYSIVQNAVWFNWMVQYIDDAKLPGNFIA